MAAAKNKNIRVNLIERGGWYHCVINYHDEQNKRKQKSIALGLRTKGNKRRAEEKMQRVGRRMDKASFSEQK